YNITFTAVQDADDANPDDNVRTSSFRISEAEYARDRGAAENEFTNYDDDYKLGTTYYIEDNETLYCLGVALSTSSVAGATYNLELLDAFEFGYIGETTLAEVPVDNLNGPGDSNWEYRWMDGPVTLTAGTDYLAVVNHFGGSPDVVARL